MISIVIVDRHCVLRHHSGCCSCSLYSCLATWTRLFSCFLSILWLLSSSALQLLPPFTKLTSAVLIILSWSLLICQKCLYSSISEHSQLAYCQKWDKPFENDACHFSVAQKSCFCFLHQIILINLSALTLIDWNAVWILALFQILINLIVVACI